MRWLAAKKNNPFFTLWSLLNSLSIMINNTVHLADWSIICISPGIRNLITYIENSEWIDTQYIIDRRRPFAQCQFHIEKKLRLGRQVCPTQHIVNETSHFEETARFCFSSEERGKVSGRVISFHICMQTYIVNAGNIANFRR